MKTRTFTYGVKTVTTSDKNEIKRLKACGWIEAKKVELVFAKGLKNGNNHF